MTLLLTTRAKEIDIDSRDWPRCAKCHLPVEDFRVSDTGDSLIVVASCHGDEQVVTIPDDLWDSVIGRDFSIGPVFGGT